MTKILKTSILNGPQFYKFSDCFLDTVERRLFKDNKKLDVTSRELEVLQVLVENSGEVVSKSDLLDQIWGDSFVEEGNLPVQISKIRSQLGANKNEPYIVTESGVGYRFVSPVRILDDDEWADLIENELAQHEDGKQKFTSIAIMPLINETGGEDVEYLADGITESLINSLASSKDLRVIARNTVFQFKGAVIDVKKLGRKLRVATILTGRLRVVREKVVIWVELSKVADGTHIWGIRLEEELDDIFEIQDKLSVAIGGELKLQVAELNALNSITLEEAPPDTYRLYLKGKFLRRKGGADNLAKAVECLNEALAFDPIFPELYFELADCYFWLCAYDLVSFAEIDPVIRKMLKQGEMLNGNKVKLFHLQGLVEFHFHRRFDIAKQFFIESLSFDSSFLPSNFSLGNLLVNTGKTSEALQIAQKMLRLDPISNDNVRNISKIYYKAGQFEAAVVLLEESLEIEPHDFESMILIAANLIELGKFDAAHIYIDAAWEIQKHLELQTLKCYAYAKNGDVKKANSILDSLDTKLLKDSDVPSAYLAIIYSELGEIDLAFEMIEKSISNNSFDILSLPADPRFSKLRSDIRYERCLNLIGY